MADILPALAQRRAFRAFDPRPVTPDVRHLLWQAVSVSPSHGNSQPVRLLVASSPSARDALIPTLTEGNRAWAPAAPLLVGIAVLPAHDGVVENSDGSKRELWAFHAGIAAAHLMAQATALGLVAHPMAGFDEVAARRAFGAPDDVRVLAVVAIGYPGPAESLPEDLRKREKMPQDRLPLANLVVEDRWLEQHSVSARDLRKRAAPG